MTEQQGTTATQDEPRRRVRQTGIVASIAGVRSVVVQVERQVKDKRYHKYVGRRSKFMAHDEQGAGVGDIVEIVSSRPLSARKRWRVAKIVRRAAIPGGTSQDGA